jgi:hypothetical protein
VKDDGRAFAALRRAGTFLRNQSQAEEQGIRNRQDFAIRPMLGGYRLYAYGDRLFCCNVGGRVDFALQAPQVFQIAASGLPPTRFLVALDFILDLK